MRKKLTTEEFIINVKNIHNNKYNYSKVVYSNAHQKVSIICKVHGEFLQTPNDHQQGSGCPKCKGEKLSIKFRSTKEKFIKNSKKIHGNKYNYSKTKYFNCSKKVEIICKKHGSFYQTPWNHLVGCGCPKCKSESIHVRCNKGIKKFIIDANKIHKNRYDYSKSIYKTGKILTEIICKNHGIFWQTPFNHLAGHGCPKCFFNLSKRELEFLNHLNIPDTKYHRQVNILRKRVDGYNPKTKTIYEFLGDYYHGNPKRYNSKDYNVVCHKTFGELYNKTIDKFDFLKQNGYIIKYIWETDWDKFKNGIDKSPNIISYI